MQMVTEAQKKASRKWDSENIRTVACRMRTDEQERFKKYAEERGTTMSALLLAYIRQCINAPENTTEE